MSSTQSPISLLGFLLLAGAACNSGPQSFSDVICEGEHNCHCALSGWQVCGDRCVNPLSDHDNCGSCGNSCGAQVCLSGVCADSCGELETCGETCRLPDDPFNCGGCGTRCEGACANGICQEYVDCGLLTACQGRCVDTRSDIHNCGGCGKDCLGLPYCNNGSCAECPVGLTSCYGDCVDLEQDRNNCGRCGNWCTNDSYNHQYCEDGWCEECPIEENKRVCHNTCVSLATDENCGDCDVTCTDNTSCHNGWCQTAY